MSYLAQSKRVSYIDGRLKYKKDYPSAKTLSEDYLAYSGDEFSTKTFSRDIEWLRNQNAPIVYDSSRKGYYYTDETFNLPTIKLTGEDLLSLLVIDRALGNYRNSPFYERLQKVFEGLKRHLPDKVSIHSRELASNFSVIPEPVTEINSDIWLSIQEGMEQGRCLEIKYQAPGHNKPTIRKLDPYHLVGQKGEWYLLSKSHRDNQIRVYALTRMKACIVHKDKFTYPADFNPEDYIDPSFGVFATEKKVEIAIKFYSPTASVIKERSWHPNQEIEELADGSIILRYTSNQQSQTLYWVSHWGPDAEILEPEELRNKATKWFSETKSRYN
ncbi:MAG: WYL domain-containing protein [Spirochaetia bacterium]|jgi:predicted DNA-binding transcriptional regulator YafY|nr:WYL domain-containing protein [Spirochaetia bacterium]